MMNSTLPASSKSQGHHHDCRLVMHAARRSHCVTIDSLADWRCIVGVRVRVSAVGRPLGVPPPSLGSPPPPQIPPYLPVPTYLPSQICPLASARAYLPLLLLNTRNSCMNKTNYSVQLEVQTSMERECGDQSK